LRNRRNSSERCREAGLGDLAGPDLESGEQGGSAVSNVVVRPLLRQVGAHRQDRRGPVQGLDLALFVDREHHCLLRRVQVQPYDVTDLRLQFRVGGELERLLFERFDAPPLPDLGDRDVGDPELFAQDAAGPVGDPEVFRRSGKGCVDHLDLVDLRLPGPGVSGSLCKTGPSFMINCP